MRKIMGRRFASVVLAGVVSGSLLLSSVAPVHASTTYEVEFPPVDVDGTIFFELNLVGSNCYGKYYLPDGTLEYNYSFAAGGGANPTCNIGSGANQPGNYSVQSGQSPYHPALDMASLVGQTMKVSATVKNGGTVNHAIVLAVGVTGSAYGSLSGGSASTIISTGSIAPGVSASYGPSDWVVPSGARRLRFDMNDYTNGVTALRVDYPPTFAGGDCAGTGSMAGGGGMVEVDWGDFYSSSIERCRSSAGPTVTIDVLLGVVEGTTVQFESYFCTDGQYRNVVWAWLITGGTPQIAASFRSNRLCGSVSTHSSGADEAPAGVYGLSVTMSKFVYQEAHVVTVDPFDEGGGFGGGGSGDELAANCTPPDGGWIDLDWFGYVGCVLLDGFASLGDLIGSIAAWLGGFDEWLLDTLTSITNPIWEAVSSIADFLTGGLSTTIGQAVTDFGCFIFGPDEACTDGGSGPGLLANLLIPAEGALDDDVDALMDTADGKIPFVWVSEVGGVLGDMTSAGSMAGGAIDFDMSIMGAAVSIDPAVVSGPVSAYRPVLAGLVWFGLAWAVLSQIGGALGLHRAEGAE